MIKISFSGISGCGKTALLIEGKKILALKEGVESIEDISKKNPFGTGRESNFVGEFYCMTKQINEENLKSLAAPRILLCDTSIWDHWIHWQHYISTIEKNENLKAKIHILRNLYHFWIKTYDIIFHIRIDSSLQEKRKNKDNFNPIDTEYPQLESRFIKSIQDDRLQVVEIWNNGTVDEGAQEIVKRISDFLQK